MATTQQVTSHQNASSVCTFPIVTTANVCVVAVLVTRSAALAGIGKTTQGLQGLLPLLPWTCGNVSKICKVLLGTLSCLLVEWQSPDDEWREGRVEQSR